ncbi:M28 family peptidase [Tamlana fucoidanivorans]|uniref:Carboxypeptidase Q n=1 Tax=Allotamlana fucoidanivorans TaxID=2583814 RepID=A0A5C4SH09_9FLAO|nr:M28 family peptidase [Tamlana fucoidanivorans]TNJ42881.1 M28 family peptidase [Tamlana fucoidanivorans]
MNRIKLVLTLILCLCVLPMKAQSDEAVLKTIYTQALTNGHSYEWLNYLSNQIGSRLSGSLGASKAVTYTKETFEQLGLDKVWLQPVMVPRWVRGTKEYAFIEGVSGKTTTVNICALGGSVATPALGVKAQVVEVKSMEELQALGKEIVHGKIVFFNKPLPAEHINPIEAYNACVHLREQGATEAAKYGAVGIIVRSLTFRMHDLPHTGSMTYNGLPDNERIPAAAISTNDAELLSTMLKLNNNIQFYFKQSCKQLKEVQSYNVIGEIKGSKYPNKYIIVGAHLDSWDLGDGAHDNGAGVVQAMEVLHLLKKLDIKPKHSIRVVLFMNQENGLRGASTYAEAVKQNDENHMFAIESDTGGFSPRGFNFDCNDQAYNQMLSWQGLFEPYLVHSFEKNESEADVKPLKSEHNVVAGLFTDNQRYFDYHHASNDTFETVNKRELELGAATMAALVYLVDKYGIKGTKN